MTSQTAKKNLQALLAGVTMEPDLGADDDTEQDNDEGKTPAAEEPDDGRLKVLKDQDAQRLVTKIYTSYVSENDFSEIVLFIKDFDALLAKFRKNKPLTPDEINKIEKEEGEGRSSKKAGKETESEIPPPPEDSDDEPGTEDDDDGEEPSVTVSSLKVHKTAKFLANRMRNK